MAVDVDRLLEELTLVGDAGSAQLVEAITEPPVLTRSITEASTLDVTVSDRHRALLRSGILDTRSWAMVDGRGYEYVRFTKSGDRLTLTFEDSVAAALRQIKHPRSWPAGTTRAQVLTDLAAEAGVPADVDPTDRGRVADAIERSAAGSEPTSSWSLSGSVSTDVAWRRFTDGQGLVAGPDAWLMDRFEPVVLREFTGGVHHIDTTYDVGMPQSTATVHVDAARWAAPMGSPVETPDLGPGSGRWLAATFRRTLTQQRGTVGLIRATPALPEPQPAPEQRDAAGGAAGGGEAGETGFLPSTVVAGTTAATPAGQAAVPGPRSPREAEAAATAASSPRQKMVSWALARVGKPYVFGASGPGSYDCSGLVQEATRAAGKVLAKGSKAQWARVSRDGLTISAAEGLRTRGAIMFRMTGDPTHVGISLGDGSTVEARGRAYGVCVVRRAGTGGWTGAALWL